MKLLLLILLLGLATSPARAEEAEPSRVPLFFYKPMYFLMGNYYTKVQLSFKAQVDSDVPLYFGYTQTMFWDLFIRSPAFRDISYQPEIFYRFFIHNDQDQWLDVGPWLHESNGRGGPDEVSWNRAYVRYHTRTDVSNQEKLDWTGSLWAPYFYNRNNPDLAQYKGIYELSLTWSDFLGPSFDVSDLTFRIYPGGETLINPARGGQELTFRVKGAWRKFLPLFVAQIFHGYGEDLIDYQQNRWAFRVGLGF